MAENITALLATWNAGDATALDQLVPIVYGELRKIAASRLRSEQNCATLTPTALVHEVYLRFANQQRVNYGDRKHFFRAAARIVRRILVDHARERNALKRGGEYEQMPLTEGVWFTLPADLDLVDLDQALDSLEQVDEQKARVVELRYFAGLSIPETADTLGLSPTTVKREWAVARAWLYDRLGGQIDNSFGAHE